MALSFSTAKLDRLKNPLTCFSVANLCFLRRWYDLEHLNERSMDYYRSAPAGESLLWATLISAFLLAAMLWLAWLWVERRPTPARLKVAHCGFLLLLIFSLESVRRYWNENMGRVDLGSSITLLLLEGFLAAGLAMALFGNPRVVVAARRVALMLTLMFPVLMIDLGVDHINAEPASAYLPKPSLPMLPPRSGSPPRVIWMLFDEFDQRLAFDARPPSVGLPELDRLQTESVVANRAIQAAPWTILALPSLLSGTMFASAELVDAATLRVYPGDSKPGLNWRDQSNVFKQARAMGANAELIGWHHPYCRVLGDSLVRCLDVPGGHPPTTLLPELYATEEGVLKMVGSLFRLQFENLREMLGIPYGTNAVSYTDRLAGAFVQRRMQQQYFLIRDRAYAAAVDPHIDFLFVHFPTPHMFAIYDRHRREFTLSSSNDYLDNLALVDRTVGEMRHTLERAGLWEKSAILISADHGLRPALWRGHYSWTEEMDRVTAGGASETVPFIVKPPGRNAPMVYGMPFSNVVTGALNLAILGGQVSTPKQIAAWLDSHGPEEHAGIGRRF